MIHLRMWNARYFLSGLVKLEKPVYYAFGNHEYGYMEATGDALIQKNVDTGVKVLEKEYLDLNIKDQVIRIDGLYDYAFALDGNDSTKSENMDSEVYSFLTSFQDIDAYITIVVTVVLDIVRMQIKGIKYII